MTQLRYFLCLLAFGLLSLSLVEALNLNTFSGQATALNRQRKKALGQYRAKEEILPMRMSVQASADEDEDDELSCSKNKGCQKGCCGPLQVPKLCLNQ